MNIKFINPIIILTVFIISFCNSCSKCDDCKEHIVKHIKYLDKNENNLLFGENMLFNPDSIVLNTDNENTETIWKNEKLGTIWFYLEHEYSYYFVHLTDSLVDTLEFELAERKSDICCGNIVYSTKTFVNSKETDNNDIITIIR